MGITSHGLCPRWQWDNPPDHLSSKTAPKIREAPNIQLLKDHCTIIILARHHVLFSFTETHSVHQTSRLYESFVGSTVHHTFMILGSQRAENCSTKNLVPLLDCKLCLGQDLYMRNSMPIWMLKPLAAKTCNQDQEDWLRINRVDVNV